VGGNDSSALIYTNIAEDDAKNGINFEKGKWRTRIRFYGKDYHLGYHDDKMSALQRRIEAEAHTVDGDFLEWFNAVVKNSNKNGSGKYNP
jgi:hypothetical protein